MTIVNAPRIGLIIPVLNAAPHLESLLPAIQQQSFQTDRFIVIDSESDDDSVARFRAAGAEILSIERQEFDHGGTRQLAVEALAECDILLFLTQDAYPASSDSFARLIEAFADPAVGVAYGRQLPHRNANAIGQYARIFNYPPTSHTESLEQRHTSGIRTVFCSNSFAAYRRSALQQVGGFPNQNIFGEDSLVTARLLKHGWSKRYVAEAEVFHSHNYSLYEDFRRAFDIGVFHNRERWIAETFGGAGGEGRRFVCSEIRYLLHHNPSYLISAIARTGAKALGYNLGKRNRILPNSWCQRFSMNQLYWRRSDRSARASS